MIYLKSMFVLLNTLYAAICYREDLLYCNRQHCNQLPKEERRIFKKYFIRNSDSLFECDLNYLPRINNNY